MDFLCTFGSGAVGPDDPPRHLCWHIKERPCKNLTDEAEGGHTGSGGGLKGYPGYPYALKNEGGAKFMVNWTTPVEVAKLILFTQGGSSH